MDKTRIEKFRDHITPKERCCNSVPAGWCVRGCRGGSYGGKSSRNQCGPHNPAWIPYDEYAGRPENAKECTNVPTCKVGDTRILDTINKDGGSSAELTNVLTKLYNDPLSSPEYSKCYEPICESGATIKSYSRKIINLQQDLQNLRHAREVWTVRLRNMKSILNLIDSISVAKKILTENLHRMDEAEWGADNGGVIEKRILANRQEYYKKSEKEFIQVVKNLAVHQFRGRGVSNLTQMQKKPYNTSSLWRLKGMVRSIIVERQKKIDAITLQQNNLLNNEKNCQGIDISPGKNDLGSCSMSGIVEDKEKAACNKMCQSSVKCKAFVIRDGICFLKSQNGPAVLSNSNTASYKPLRSCDSNNWTVKTLVNSFSGNRKNNRYNEVIIPMKGPIGVSGNHTWATEFTYTFWLRINHQGNNWRAIFRRGPQHPEDTIRAGRYTWEESRGPGVWIWPKGHGRDNSIHIRFNTSRAGGSWQQGYDIPSSKIKFHQWHHIAFSIKNTRWLKVYVDGHLLREQQLTSPITDNENPEWPIIVGGGSEGGHSYPYWNNLKSDDHWPGFNLRKLQVYRSELSQEYINSLIKSDRFDGITAKALHEDFESNTDIYSGSDARKKFDVPIEIKDWNKNLPGSGKGPFTGATKTLVDSIVNHEHINTDSSTTRCKVKNPSQMVYVNQPSTYRNASNYCKSIGRNILSFAGAEGKGGGYGGSRSWATSYSGQAPEGHLGVRVAKRINDYKLAQVKELVKSQAEGSRKTFGGGGIWVGTNDRKKEQVYINPDGQLGPIPENNHRKNVSGSGIGNPVDRIDIQGFYPCQKWSKQSPHAHGRAQHNDNIHRNPDNEPGGDWCYTADPNNRWNHNNPKSQAPLWFAGEPNDWGGGEDCVHLTRWGSKGTPNSKSRGIRLNDIVCNYKLPFVCEKEIDEPTSLGSNACLDSLPKSPVGVVCPRGMTRGDGQEVPNYRAATGGDGWEYRTPSTKWCPNTSCYGYKDGLGQRNCFLPK